MFWHKLPVAVIEHLLISQIYSRVIDTILMINTTRRGVVVFWPVPRFRINSTRRNEKVEERPTKLWTCNYDGTLRVQ